MADDLDRILDRIEADLAAVEDALAALEAGADLPLDELREPVAPGDLADLLAAARVDAAAPAAKPPTTEAPAAEAPTAAAPSAEAPLAADALDASTGAEDEATDDAPPEGGG